MTGCKPLTDKEIQGILKSFKGKYANRDRCLFILGLKAGFRISELLSLTIGDVLQFGEVVDSVTVQRKNMKGKQRSRTVPLHNEAKQAIRKWIDELNELGYSNKDDYLFQSQKSGNHSINRQQAHNILKKIVNECKIKGKVSTHSMRKTFASSMYDKLDGNIFKVKEAMGHVSVNSTVSYLSFKQDEIDNAILS